MMKSVSEGDASAGGLFGSPLRLVLMASLGVGFYILAWSFGSLPTLGDEGHHFRQAVSYYEAPFFDFRVTHDPACPPGDPSALNYSRNWLWHAGLSCLWRILGHPYVLAAQVYQVVFFVVLAVFTYLVGRELYGHRGGLWAWALLVTAPINLLFGTLFYLEVPMLAFGAMALYFLVRRWPVLLGLAWAAMFQTKTGTSAVLAAPMFLVALLSLGESWRQRLGRSALALAVFAVAMAPDCLWSREHFGNAFTLSPPNLVAPYTEELSHHLGQMPPVVRGAVPFSILDLGMTVMMLGVPGTLAVVAAVCLGVWGVVVPVREAFRRWRAAGVRQAVGSCLEAWPLDSRMAGVPLVFYVVVFAAAPQLRGSHDIRYFHPALLLASLLAGGLLARWHPLSYAGRRRWWVRAAAWLLVGGMAVQGLAAPPAIRARRALPPEVADAFEWIRRNTPPKSHILYLEVNITALTGRPIVWAAALPQYLFHAPESHQMQMLYFLHTDYIAIHPARQCQSSSPSEVPTAYPRPWVRSLAARPYLTLVYPPGGGPAREGEFLLYRIDYDKVPKEWLAGGEPTWWKDEKGRQGGGAAP